MLHGALTGVIQDEEGQILEAHSISAGLDYPGVGPEHAWLRDSGRVRYEAVEDGAAVEAFHRVAELEGILPALESSHAVAWVLANPRAGLSLMTLSGRGDKDLAEVLALRMSISSAFSQQRQARRSDAVFDGGLSEHRGDRFRLGWRLPTRVLICSSSGFRSRTRWPTGR